MKQIFNRFFKKINESPNKPCKESRKNFFSKNLGLENIAVNKQGIYS